MTELFMDEIEEVDFKEGRKSFGDDSKKKKIPEREIYPFFTVQISNKTVQSSTLPPKDKE